AGPGRRPGARPPRHGGRTAAPPRAPRLPRPARRGLGTRWRTAPVRSPLRSRPPARTTGTATAALPGPDPALATTGPARLPAATRTGRRLRPRSTAARRGSRRRADPPGTATGSPADRPVPAVPVPGRPGTRSRAGPGPPVPLRPRPAPGPRTPGSGPASGSGTRWSRCRPVARAPAPRAAATCPPGRSAGPADRRRAATARWPGPPAGRTPTVPAVDELVSGATYGTTSQKWLPVW